ncbi:hypothetical protein FACS1894127_6320 [Clostridia bacterium]|nr:hypothetical protein FACS1894127_6320 [Clostridia bacterium]
MRIKELLAKQEALLNAAKAAGRDLNETEKTEFDSLQKEIDELKKGISADEKTALNGGEMADQQMIRDTAISEERKRISEISELCKSFDVSADDYIKNGNTVAEVKDGIIAELLKGGMPVPVNVTADETDKERSAMVDGLLLRGGIMLENPAPGANEFRAMSLRDMAIDTLTTSGETGLQRKSADDLFDMVSRSFLTPTAAFPSILDQAINKAYTESYRKVRVTFDKFTTKGSLSDFKLTDGKYLAGPAGAFLEVPEGGELKHDVPVDEKLPGRQLRTFGRQFTMSRQAFINDDIGFLSSIPARYAASAKKTINKQVFDILYKNPAIYDGIQLFDTAHNNLLASGSGVTGAAIMSMMMKLQIQKDQFGDAINIQPAILLVPIGYGFTLQTIFMSATINTPGNTQAVNPLYQYQSSLEVVEDGTLNALAGSNAAPWFLFGDRNDVAGIQVDYLNGQEVPNIRRMEVSGQLGFVWDIYLDWGITVMDYRGIVKNPGEQVQLS